MLQFQNVSDLSGSVSAEPPHRKHSLIRHRFSCFVIWIIWRDSIGFWCYILYFCRHAFKYVPMPLGYHLYAAAKRMNALCWRAPDVFPILETPRSVRCTWHTPRIDLCERHQSQQSPWMCFRDTLTMYSCMFFFPCYSFTRFYSRTCQFYAYRKKLFPESVNRNIGFQILQGLSFIHKHGRCNDVLLCRCNRKQMVKYCKIREMAEP